MAVDNEGAVEQTPMLTLDAVGVGAAAAAEVDAAKAALAAAQARAKAREAELNAQQDKLEAARRALEGKKSPSPPK